MIRPAFAGVDFRANPYDLVRGAHDPARACNQPGEVARVELYRRSGVMDIMGSFSLMHWIVVLAIILILFGAGKLPRVMGDFAKGIKAFKAGMREDDEPEPAASPAQVASPVAAASPAASAATADRPHDRV